MLGSKLFDIPSYDTLPNNLIKGDLVDLIERIFQTAGSNCIVCYDRHAFFTSDAVRNYNLWSYQRVFEALTFLLDNIHIRFGSPLNRQIVGISKGTNCLPLVADLFSPVMRDTSCCLFQMLTNLELLKLSIHSTSRYLDDQLNIDNNFFDSMVNHIYPPELQYNKANVSDTDASFLDLPFPISAGFVRTKCLINVMTLFFIL